MSNRDIITVLQEQIASLRAQLAAREEELSQISSMIPEGAETTLVERVNDFVIRHSFTHHDKLAAEAEVERLRSTLQKAEFTAYCIRCANTERIGGGETCPSCCDWTLWKQNFRTLIRAALTPSTPESRGTK